MLLVQLGIPVRHLPQLVRSTTHVVRIPHSIHLKIQARIDVDGTKLEATEIALVDMMIGRTFPKLMMALLRTQTCPLRVDGKRAKSANDASRFPGPPLLIHPPPLVNTLLSRALLAPACPRAILGMNAVMVGTSTARAIPQWTSLRPLTRLA